MEKIQWHRIIVLVLVLFNISWAKASPAGQNDNTEKFDTANWQSWQQVGSAQLSVFVFDIYQSRLLTPTGVYNLGNDITPHPLALDIRYQRDISKKQLLEATYEQWVKLGFNQQQSTQWIEQLELIFPNIKEGQRLTYVTNGQTGQFVYSLKSGQQKKIGYINDESLNDAFLAIWLSPKTEYADLRRRLIGMKR